MVCPRAADHGAGIPVRGGGLPGSEGPVTIFEFADSAGVGYAEGYQAGRIIEAPADMGGCVTES